MDRSNDRWQEAPAFVAHLSVVAENNAHGQAMASLKVTGLGVLATVCGAATVFFTYFAVRLVYAALAWEGEGSLGHVGMLIGAGLYPLLALFFGGCTFLAWRRMRRP